MRSILSSHKDGVDEAVSLSRGSPARIEALRRLLEDPQDTIRRDAGWALHYILGACTVPLPLELTESLGMRLGDRDPNVRRAAMSALSGYVLSLQKAGVDRKAIMEIIEPAMPYLREHDCLRSPARKDFGL